MFDHYTVAQWVGLAAAVYVYLTFTYRLGRADFS